MMILRKARKIDESVIGSMWMDMLEEVSSASSYLRPAADAPERWSADFSGWLGDDERRIVIAENGDDRVGYIHAQTWALPPIYEGGREIFVNELYVRPEYRGKGLARRLLTDVKDWGIEKGIGQLRARVLNASTASVAFWAACGARPVTTDYVLELPMGRQRKIEDPVRFGF